MNTRKSSTYTSAKKNKHLLITTLSTNTRFLTQYTQKAETKQKPIKTPTEQVTQSGTHNHNTNSYHVRTIPKKRVT